MNESNLQKDITKMKIDAEFKLEEYKLLKKFEIEEIRHKHILEEIKAMQEAKIKSFVRQVKND